MALGSGNLISTIILGLFWFFLAALIPKEEYGQIGYLMSLANVVFPIAMLGLGITIVVYEAKKENIFPAAFVIVLLTSIIAAILVSIIFQNWVVGLLVIGLSLFEIISLALTSKSRYHAYSLHFALRAGITVFFALILYPIWGINGILVGYFIGTLIVLKEFFSLRESRKFEFSKLRSKFRFTLNLYFNRISRVVFQWGDKLVIGNLFGFVLLGSYYFAAQYMIVLEIIPRAIRLYLIPQEAAGTDNKKIKFFAVGVSCVIAVVSIFAAPILINLLLPQYQESIIPIQIMSIAVIPRSISTIQQAEFLGRENSKVILVGGILQAAVYFVLIFTLGTLFELVGLAIAFLVAILLRTGYNLAMKKYIDDKKSIS